MGEGIARWGFEVWDRLLDALAPVLLSKQLLEVIKRRNTFTAQPEKHCANMRTSV